MRMRGDLVFALVVQRVRFTFMFLIQIADFLDDGSEFLPVGVSSYSTRKIRSRVSVRLTSW